MALADLISEYIRQGTSNALPTVPNLMPPPIPVSQPVSIPQIQGPGGVVNRSQNTGIFGRAIDNVAKGANTAVFQNAVQKLIAASGGKIKVTSGTRSHEEQTALWNAALRKYGSPEVARNWVAPPGTSKHELGLANDLWFANPQVQQWAHQNAGSFGLVFPLSNEAWHVELRGAR